MQVTIIECDGCGKRAEYAYDGTIKTSENVSEDNKKYLAMNASLGNIDFNVCSPECVSAAMEKVFAKNSGKVSKKV
jgi:hypothetical protein